jgi:hypothetical protein
MTSRTLIATVCCFITIGSFLLAEDTDATATTSEPESFILESKETRILHKLLEMEDEELASLRQTIEHIEKMSPEERARLRTRIGVIHRMPPEKVDRLRRKFRAIPEEQRDAMRTRWMEMSPEEHAELRSKLKEMTPEERQAFLLERGLLPPHPRRHHKVGRSENLEGKNL